MLTSQERLVVAEAVLKKPCRLVSDYIAACGPRPDQYHYRWAPDYKITQKDALVRKCAALIRKAEDPWLWTTDFIVLLDNNDTDGMETMCYQLITTPGAAV